MQPEPSLHSPVAFGRFKLIRRIGAGGMGEVFLAREENGARSRACVVKKVLPNLVENRAFVGRFLDESKVVVRLRHPNVARVYAMGEVKGEYFLAMEYVQGKTVSRFTRRLRDLKQQLPLGLVLLIGERVCQGLAYAHEAKDEDGAPLHLVHRDLSPANVCISYRGEVKIIDFGAAQSTLKEEQTAPRVVIGNLTYMSPEQAKKQIVDRRADVYSTGVMLWELLAWHLLPQKGDPLERWRKAANPVWEPPSKLHPRLPLDVDDAVMRALQKEREQRWRDAAVFGAELKRLRSKYAPDASERDLGELLTRAFAAEKVAEDAVLEETLQGVPLGEEPTDKTKRPFFAPPTALAFEHTAIVPPADVFPSGDDEVTDPGEEGTPTPAQRPARLLPVNPTRMVFGADLTAPQDESLLQEIEALSSDDFEPSTIAKRPGQARWLLAYAAVFVLAAGLGFFGVWWWGMTGP
ncbi:MAG: serine/threonine protein kinase [Myxococcota bacterium]